MPNNPIVVKPTRLDGVKLLVRAAHPDTRGFFRRLYSESEYVEVGITDRFCEDNMSTSRRGVLRGLHYDFRLAKFVQVVEGEIFDVVVDLRRSAPTFGQWEAFRISSRGCEQIYVPRGFAHGFYVLSEFAVVTYKQTEPYDAQREGQVRWDDPDVGVAWPLDGEPILSVKDRAAPALASVP